MSPMQFWEQETKSLIYAHVQRLQKNKMKEKKKKTKKKKCIVIIKW